MTDLASWIHTQLDPEEVREKQHLVFEEVLFQSDCLKTANFNTIDVSDLHLLFELYDKHFFDGHCLKQLRNRSIPIRMRISSRMTSAGGKTTMFYPNGSDNDRGKSFEIAVSSVLFFESFDLQKSSTVVGLRCQNRLEALQRVFEHEMVHLIEMLVWAESSCAKRRFRTLARNHFGHLESNHQLVTPKEAASHRFNIRMGDQVQFEADGQRKTGFVNRITRRATVLVRDLRGQVYDDGKRYVRYYVPLSQLNRAS